MTLLKVSGLVKRFGGVRAVDGVSLEVDAGTMVALIGPNGAGKTTCFNCIGGQIRPDGGSITLDGRELVGLSPRRIWRLGLGRTFQVAATFASMTVRHNVQMALLARDGRALSLTRRAAAYAREEALALIERVGLAPRGEEICAALSYGDLKRVELALALAHGPSLLLMDEPTAGMASSEREALMRLVATIVRERGMGVLFTEHDMDVVFGHAERVLVMDRGKLIADGPPRQVREDPRVQAVYLGAPHSLKEVSETPRKV